MALPNITKTSGFISYFHHILSTPGGSIPKGAQWLVAFENLGGLMSGIETAVKREGKPWMIDTASKAIIGETFQENSGCVFCQAIALPGEKLTTNPAGNITNGAFGRAYVGEGRDQWPQMRMSFLDTNISFVDNFLRAWVLSTGNHGLIARYPWSAENYRTNIICWKLGSYSPTTPPTILQKTIFYDACCVSVSEEEYTYEATTAPVRREAQFIYNYYSIDTQADNDLFLKNYKSSDATPQSATTGQTS